MILILKKSIEDDALLELIIDTAFALTVLRLDQHNLSGHNLINLTLGTWHKLIYKYLCVCWVVSGANGQSSWVLMMRINWIYLPAAVYVCVFARLMIACVCVCMAVVRTHRQIADCNQTAIGRNTVGTTDCLFSLLTTERETNKVREELLARNEDINSRQLNWY